MTVPDFERQVREGARDFLIQVENDNMDWWRAILHYEDYGKEIGNALYELDAAIKTARDVLIDDAHKRYGKK